MARLLTILFVLALSSPALALELRHGPAEEGCTKDTPRVENAVHKWTGQLGGPNTAKSWRRLMRSGRHGCDAVAAWLGQGAPAAPDSEIAEAVQSLLRRGSQANVEAAVLALSHPSDEVVAAAAFGLRSRLPVLDRSLAEQIVAAAQRPWPTVQDAPDPRGSLLGLLVGRHAEGRIQYVDDGPISVAQWVETTAWSAEAMPPLHLEGLAALMAGADPGLELAFALLARSVVDEDHPAAPDLGPLLVPLLQRVGPDRATAQLAAEALGRGQPPGIDAAVDAVIAQRNPPYLAPHLLNGFEDRIKAGPVDAALVDRLERLRGLVLQGAGRRADRLWKQARKKLR